MRDPNGIARLPSLAQTVRDDVVNVSRSHGPALALAPHT